MNAIVNDTLVELKNNPSENSIIIDEVFLGMEVEILWEDINDYYYIKTDYDYKGYASKKSFTIEKNKVDKWKKAEKYIVSGEYIDVLENNFYDSKIVISLVRGSKIIKSNSSNNIRFQIFLPDGRKGWIRSEFLSKLEDVKLKDKEKIRNEIVDNAYKYIGKQFRWGGKSPFGLDSSGLVSVVYMLSNLKIWRDSNFVDKYLLQIKKEELRRGDLIFGVDHIAIYLGKDKFINSSAVDGIVVIKSLNYNDDNYHDIFEGQNTIYACHKLLRG
ncbi:C40 family peptidase [Helicovermis profundi]|uniref:NlpC/P60 domain-containing protein n=1 Tax=Helicovermis profundi TaxID=3065157 RepID=A0AAU9E3X4_9FIRM|nr:hypothetical protein HLPR_09810 [Clostridia bacterium S502]